MFFLASKTLSFVEQPLNVVALLFVVSVLLARRRPLIAQRVAVVALAAFFLIGLTAVPQVVLRALENMYAPTRVPLESLAGAIILGGAEDAGLKASERGQVLLNGAAERLNAGVRLLREHPHYVIVHTGFSGRLNTTGMTESELARRFFVEMGADVSRIVFEDRARDTYENAALTRHLTGVDPTRRWLLVTSARHMPRSMAVFEKQGWDIEPLPVDYRNGVSIDWAYYSIVDGANYWGAALHELIGLVVYKLTGRI